MAHKKGVGSSDNGRDSNSKRLGVKIFGGQSVRAGNIIIRQRGTKYHAGKNAYLGRDFTLHAAVDGIVEFTRKRQNRVYVNIIPSQEELEKIAKTATAKKKPAKVTEPEVVVVEATLEGTVVEEPVAVEEIEIPTEEVTEVEAKGVIVEDARGVEEELEIPKVGEVDAEVLEEATAAVENLETAEVEVEAETVVEEPKPKAASKPDKLTKIEGIGPKIESLLKDAGITTFALLSETAPEKIREILTEAGSRYQMHDPTTWPKQAGMAAANQWDELKVYQDRLDGGKEPTE